MTVSTILNERVFALEELALEAGAKAAKCFSARFVAFDERVRMKCQVPLCPHYGHCLTCPPNVPSMEEFKAVVEKFDSALLIQTSSPILGDMDQADREEVIEFMTNPGKQGKVDSESSEAFKDLNASKMAAVKLHKVVNEVEGKALGLGFHYATGLIGGPCEICIECVGQGSGEGCRRPYEAQIGRASCRERV